jgi:hypothetical protein
MNIKHEVTFTSKEMKKMLKVTDCELMHLRTARKIKFQHDGRAFIYSLPDDLSLLEHPLGKQLLGWHLERHPHDISNKPKSTDTIQALELLVSEILIPIECEFGDLKVTYGFTSSELAAYIRKNASAGTAPSLDQHSSCEHNQRSNKVCERGGSACDFIIENESMADVTRFITKYLNFDRIYYYGANRPIHVSVNNVPSRHLQLMSKNAEGRRFPSRKAYGDAAITLSENL